MALLAGTDALGCPGERPSDHGTRTGFQLERELLLVVGWGDARAVTDGYGRPSGRRDVYAVTPDGGLVTPIQDQAFRGPAMVAFLRQLWRQVPGKRLVIWDGASVHHAQPVKDFLAAGAADRLHLERLPGYASDRNPDGGVWNLLKRGELRNRCCQHMPELRWELGLAIRRLRRKVHLLTACFRQCGYRQ